MKFLFLVMAANLNGGWAVGYNFERGQSKDHRSQIWFRGFIGEELDLNVIFHQKISQKNDAIS